MKCIECEFFHIRQEPLPNHMDTGLAECRKHNLVTDFYNHGKLNKLECVEEQEGELMEKLKPCPFCGAEAEIQEEHQWISGCSNGVNRKYIVCTKCRNRTMSFDWDERKDMIEAWNRRKSDDEVGG